PRQPPSDRARSPHRKHRGNASMELAELESKSVEELQGIAKDMEIPEYEQLHKQDLTFKILQMRTEASGLIFGQGVLEILPDGWGFLRHDNFTPAPDDIY